jgi:hypothetical protein
LYEEVRTGKEMGDEQKREEKRREEIQKKK